MCAREDGSLHMLIKEDQLDKEFIHTVVAQDGVVQAAVSAANIAKLLLRRHFDRIEFVENNTRFYFDPESPLSRSGDANIPPAVWR